MRNADGTFVNKAREILSSEELFARTGLQTIYGNAVFQLFERVLLEDPALQHADKMLMLLDLLAYFLTGEKYGEYTIASTSMLFNPAKKCWDLKIARALGIPDTIFPEVRMPAEECFAVLPEICAEVGVLDLSYVMVGTHDTASAVAAIPLGPDEAFCSSGTWSLFGMEIDEPLLQPEAYRAGCSNEGTADGKIRL